MKTNCKGNNIRNSTIQYMANEFIVFNCNYGFYRAMRMHSADYAVARCLSARPSVCPSVRLSACHTPVLSLNGYTYSHSFYTVG